MPLFFGGARTLIVEESDEEALRAEKILSNFPDSTFVRAKTAREALTLLETDHSIEMVSINKRAYTVPQARSILAT